MSIFFSSSKHCQYLYPRKDAISPEFKGKWLLVEIVALKHSPPQNSEWRIWGEFCLKTALFIQFKAKWHPLNPAICLQKSHGIICTNDRHPPFLPRAQNSAWTSFILSLTTFIWLFVGRLSISTSLGTNTTDPANPPDHRPSGPRTTDPQDPRPLTHYPRNRPFR